MKRIVFSLLICMFLIIRCKKDGELLSVMENKLSANNWTKVSNEVISDFKDIKINNNSIYILGDKYYNLDENFTMIYKTNVGAEIDWLNKNSLLEDNNFFGFDYYNNHKGQFLMTYFKRDGNTNFDKIVISTNDLFNFGKNDVFIYNLIESPNPNFIAYCVASPSSSDSIFLFGINFLGKKLSSQVISVFERHTTPIKISQIAEINSNFIFYDRDKSSFVTYKQDGSKNIINIPYKRILKAGKKICLLSQNNEILTSVDGINFQTIINNNNNHFNSDIFRSLNDSTILVDNKGYYTLINVNVKTQKQLIGDQTLFESPCFTFQGKIIALSNKGIYARLLE